MGDPEGTGLSEYAYKATAQGCWYLRTSSPGHKSILRRQSFIRRCGKRHRRALQRHHYEGLTSLSAQRNPGNQQFRPRTGKGQGYSSGSGKGRTGYSAATAEDEEEWPRNSGIKAMLQIRLMKMKMMMAMKTLKSTSPMS